ncbi:MAG: TolC family protein [Proteobacteria bacterium]|nr:TolC family protein [Pseudomonadota bacterium]
MARPQFYLRVGVLGPVLAGVLAGCASYTSKPIVPAETAASLERRTLDAPALSQFINSVAQENASAGSAVNWDLSKLTLAALYFHPDIEVSRARFALAKAGVTTARQIPNPTLSLTPTNHTVITEPSPWTVGFLINFVVEAFGKREARTAQALALVEAARQDIATASWQVRGRVRSGLLDLWAAEGRRRFIGRRQGLQEQIVALLERRFSSGEIAAIDVARERINLNQLRLSVRQAERQAAEARASLATGIGVPVRAIETVTLNFTTFDSPLMVPDATELAGPLRRKALQERADVLGALAEYEAAQAALRLEVAKQYPDLNIGPGYTYDQGDNLYTLGISLELPIFNQNQGPISQAEARRRETAAQFIALQARIIGDIDRATASFRASLTTLATADVLRQSQLRQQQQINRAFRLGEVDRLATLTAELEVVIVESSRFDAVVQQREALASLEDALRQPMFSGAFYLAPSPSKVSDP